MENNKNTKKYPHTEADEAFNRAMTADEKATPSGASELKDDTVRSVTTGEVIPGLRIDAPMVSALGGSAVRSDLLEKASQGNDGESLKAALEGLKDPTGWERQEDATARERSSYALAADRSSVDTAGTMQSAGAGFTAEQIADMNALNQNAARPKDPTGWEQQ